MIIIRFSGSKGLHMVFLKLFFGAVAPEPAVSYSARASVEKFASLSAACATPVPIREYVATAPPVTTNCAMWQDGKLWTGGERHRRAWQRKWPSDLRSTWQHHPVLPRLGPLRIKRSTLRQQLLLLLQCSTSHVRLHWCCQRSCRTKLRSRW